MKNKIIVIILIIAIISILAFIVIQQLQVIKNNHRQNIDKTPKPYPQPKENQSITILENGEYIIHAGDHDFKAMIFVPKDWNKKCVILVHGLGSNREKWIKESVVKDLVDHRFCVLVFDLPLHGSRGKMKSFAQLPIVIKRGAEDVYFAANFLKSKGVEEVYLISRSLGSIVSAVALGNGAEISKAELLLASANLTYLSEHSSVATDLKIRSEMEKWASNQDILKEIDPLYKLPNYRGAIHFHCGKKDKVLPPETCQLAFDSASLVSEKKLFWHDTGHSMPKDLFIDEALEFFGNSQGKTSIVINPPLKRFTCSYHPSSEPPIHVLLVLHIEPRLDPHSHEMRLDSPETEREYNDVRSELEWLLDFCDKTGVKMTALFNGWYMQLAFEKNDLSLLEKLLDSGHEIGTHAHSICYDDSERKWYPCADPDRWFSDAKIAVDRVLRAIGKGENRVMCAMFPRGEYSQECSLMSRYGYDIGLGNRPEIALNFFGHIVWNPWRPSCVDDYDTSLVENFSTPFVSIDHRAQIGSTTSHGGVDSRASTLKRQFLMIFLEWKTREVCGVEDKIWSWGVVDHPNYGSRYRSDIEDFFEWLNNYFIDVVTVHGNVVAVYSTASEVTDEYYDWESSNPGRSSFSYRAGMGYPYITEFSKNILLSSQYVGEKNFGSKIVGFILKPIGSSTINGFTVKQVIILWNNGRSNASVDLSEYFSNKVNVCTPWGECTTSDPSRITVGDLPVIVFSYGATSP
ncbi:MAG: hypothetical protein DRJ35_06725 [Thermoprotei archaeon]|nr:MAG: hypothetical protein DRJ35_06725 [Thermoprotei archaeon]